MAGLSLARKIPILGGEIALREFTVDGSAIIKYNVDNLVLYADLPYNYYPLLILDHNSTVINKDKVTGYYDNLEKYFSYTDKESEYRSGSASVIRYTRATYYTNNNTVYDSFMPHDYPTLGDDSGLYSPQPLFTIDKMLPAVLNDNYEAIGVILPNGQVYSGIAKSTNKYPVRYLTYNGRLFLFYVGTNGYCYAVNCDSNPPAEYTVNYVSTAYAWCFTVINNNLYIYEYSLGTRPTINVSIKRLDITSIDELNKEINVNPVVHSTSVINNSDVKYYTLKRYGLGMLLPVYEPAKEPDNFQNLALLSEADDYYIFMDTYSCDIMYIVEHNDSNALLWTLSYSVLGSDYDKINQSFSNVFTTEDENGIIKKNADGTKDYLYVSQYDVVYDPVSNTVLQGNWTLVKLNYTDLNNNIYNPTTVVSSWNWKTIVGYYNNWVYYKNDSGSYNIMRLNVQTLATVDTGIQTNNYTVKSFQDNNTLYLVVEAYSWRNIYKINLDTFAVSGPIYISGSDFQYMKYDYSAGKFVDYLSSQGGICELVLDWNTLTYSILFLIKTDWLTIYQFDDAGLYVVLTNYLAFSGVLDIHSYHERLGELLQSGYYHENYPGFPPGKYLDEYIPVYKISYTGDTSDISDVDPLINRFERI